MSRVPYIVVDGVPAMPPKVLAILEAVAVEYLTTVEDLVGREVKRHLTRARYDAYSRIVCQVVINHAPPSLPQIGRWVNRDHTSILYGLRRHVTGFKWARGRCGRKGTGRAKGELYSRLKLAAMMAHRDADEGRAAA